ncbi:GNAT family N-acetyltransferase [Fictibacillus fluitans]|uniref:GNAT family N-acetyltransferase n=1 Tax=Fictibacillus fluitans TaxID=3058422 RepID=A0ABT8HWH5_9BACL|nr:GNAT family N-acetyltransferase [Fictibacillus sp. NE201]MDN4524612.1 GNAT family N-acetyltransferase [Fictibacillus sp. NE201]
MPLTTVLMTNENVNGCVTLYQKVFNREPWNESWTHETAGERLNDLVNTPKFFGFMFYEGEELAGFIAGNSKRTFQGLTYYIAECCVNSENQGKGYGSKMLKLLEEELKGRGVQSIYLLTATDGLAQRFYEKNGYLVNGNRAVMNKSL